MADTVHGGFFLDAEFCAFENGALSVFYFHPPTQSVLPLQALPEFSMSPLKAVIFGAIGTIAETSDLQRQSFNAAFADAGLDWHWSPMQYQSLLQTNGGQERMREFRDADPARHSISNATIERLHHAKTQHYVQLLEASDALEPRPGVAALIGLCLTNNIKLAWCTSTSLDNVGSIQRALAGKLPLDRFDTVVTIDKISRVKPAPDAYVYALAQLGLKAHEVVAIEDTPVSIAAAKAAGIFCIATPGATTGGQDFSQADCVLTDLTGLDPNRIGQLLTDSQLPVAAES